MTGELIYDPKLEAGLLGALIVDPEKIKDIADRLKPEYFRDEYNQNVCNAMKRMHVLGQKIDLITLTPQAAVPPAYITELVTKAGNPFMVDDYLNLIQKDHKRRAMEATGQKLINRARDKSIDIDQTIDKAADYTAILKANNQPIDERPRYTVRDALFAMQPKPPISYIVGDLITPGSVTIFYGDPGAKKSSVMLSMAVCVALGKPWLNRVTEQAPVLFFDEEMGEIDFSRSLEAAIRGELADENIPIKFISLVGWKLESSTDQITIENEITISEAKLVIFDALVDFMTGDENSVEAMRPVFQALKRIAVNTGTAIVVIHHSNKLGGYRGSSHIMAGVDLFIKITSLEGSNHINFKTEKVRHGPGNNSWGAEATWTNDQFYLTAGEADKYTGNKPGELYVKKYLEVHGQSSFDAILGAVDSCSERQAKNAIYSLAKQGIIKRSNPGITTHGIHAIYELV
jgi:archaellum biogenesis ATPase FlaH